MNKFVSKTIRQVGVLAVASSMMFAGSATTTMANDPLILQNLAHFEECLGWMASDPAKHAEFCAPGRAVAGTGSAVGFGDCSLKETQNYITKKHHRIKKYHTHYSECHNTGTKTHYGFSHDGGKPIWVWSPRKRQYIRAN